MAIEAWDQPSYYWKNALAKNLMIKENFYLNLWQKKKGGDQRGHEEEAVIERNLIEKTEARQKQICEKINNYAG